MPNINTVHILHSHNNPFYVSWPTELILLTTSAWFERMLFSLAILRPVFSHVRLCSNARFSLMDFLGSKLHRDPRKDLWKTFYHRKTACGSTRSDKNFNRHSLHHVPHITVLIRWMICLFCSLKSLNYAP